MMLDELQNVGNVIVFDVVADDHSRFQNLCCTQQPNQHSQTPIVDTQVVFTERHMTNAPETVASQFTSFIRRYVYTLESQTMNFRTLRIKE